MKDPNSTIDQIPLGILEQHQGEWIVWDQVDKKVVGHGMTLDEAEAQAARLRSKHLLRVHHVLKEGTEIAGML